MDDDKIVELFWQRAESAIRETEKKYARYIKYIAYRILGNHEDAEECENDVYLKTWNSILFCWIVSETIHFGLHHRLMQTNCQRFIFAAIVVKRPHGTAFADRFGVAIIFFGSAYIFGELQIPCKQLFIS